jgi:hypothetical protein
MLNELPKEQHGQTRNLLRAAWKVKTAAEEAKMLAVDIDHQNVHVLPTPLLELLNAG